MQSGRSFLSKKSTWLFYFAILAMAGFAFYNTRAQFLLWLNNDLSKHLIPPYAAINYFLKYSLYHFWLSYIISLIISLIFFFSARYYDKKHGNIFFENEELYFLALSIFLAGHPGWILYLIIMFLVTLLYSSYSWLSSKEMHRISFYYWWLPLAGLAIILDKILLNYWPFYSIFILSR